MWVMLYGLVMTWHDVLFIREDYYYNNNIEKVQHFRLSD